MITNVSLSFTISLIVLRTKKQRRFYFKTSFTMVSMFFISVCKSGTYLHPMCHFFVSIPTVINHTLNIVTFTSKLLDLSVWHQRLGHSSLLVVKKALASSNISYKNNNEPYTLCSACCISKSYALPYFTSTNHDTMSL